MNTSHHLSWDHFRATVFLPGQQRVHRVADSPRIEVFGDGVLNRIGILLQIPADTTIPPELSRLASITTRTFSKDGQCFLELATAVTSLQRQFYHFAVAVAERVIVERRPALEALSLELRCFAGLLEETAILGIERQLGLLGELFFLERLVTRMGVTALEAWLGPSGEPHDFRLGASEFEVKTTLSPHRVHTIHGTEQLIPSKGCSLFLVSVLVGPPGAGDGVSLADEVSQLSRLFEPAPGLLDQFQMALSASGFRIADKGLYGRQFAQRRPLGMIPVNESFPAITRLTLQGVLGVLAPRVDSLQYDVSVEGLEAEEGTVEFDKAFLRSPHKISG